MAIKAGNKKHSRKETKVTATQDIEFARLIFFFLIPVKTCGKPAINNVMQNLTLKPGDSAR